MKNKYGFGKVVPYTFNDAVERVKNELQKEGFGIPAEIDVASIFSKKLNKDIPPYLILGACNPEFAYQSLEIEPSLGLLLPCNVVVRQDHHDAVHVEIMDPEKILQLVRKQEIISIAFEVRRRLERVMNAL